MNLLLPGRRIFLKRAAIAASASVLPTQFAFALPTFLRPEWQVFKTTPHYASLLQAIRTMKANTNASDPKSWTYWTNIHVNTCPHGIAYFLGWHRGYLYYLEKQLRIVSGNPALVLPYWDYYADPNLPAEFTDPQAGNPLYVPRVNTNVRQALTMWPFSSSLVNFQRGVANSFEVAIENIPHNPVHDIIGGAMTTMQSPIDPIFWLHHANIDRLWVAWVAAGGNRKMPIKTNSYWNGSYAYATGLTMSRRYTYDTRTNLNYYYQKETFPTTLPALVAGSQLRVAQERDAAAARPIPPVGTYPLSNPRATSATTYSVAGALKVEMDERSISVQLPVSASYGQSMAKIARGVASPIPGSLQKFLSMNVVLDDVKPTPAGQNGGYFYQIYLNGPVLGANGGTSETTLLGTLGPFQVAGASHHPGAPARLRYPVRRLLAGFTPVQLGMLTVSFVRVDGDNSPRGPVMAIGEVRMELSTEENL